MQSVKDRLVRSLRRFSKLLADRVKACGEDFQVFRCRDCPGYTATREHCDLRVCPRCAWTRALALIKRHGRALRRLRKGLHITFTFESVAVLDGDYITWMRGCFSKLRRRKRWRWLLTDGIYGIEFTKPRFWHPHVHVLVPFRRPLSAAELVLLKADWEVITGGAHVVNLRIKTGQAVILEIVKYATKVIDFVDDPNALQEFLEAIENRHLVSGFGRYYRVRLARSAYSGLKCVHCGGSNLRKLGVVNARDVFPKGHGYAWRPPPP